MPRRSRTTPAALFLVPVTFLCIPDEEVGSPSTRARIEQEARRCRCVLVPEPGKDNKLVTGRS